MHTSMDLYWQCHMMWTTIPIPTLTHSWYRGTLHNDSRQVHHYESEHVNCLWMESNIAQYTWLLHWIRSIFPLLFPSCSTWVTHFAYLGDPLVSIGWPILLTWVTHIEHLGDPCCLLGWPIVCTWVTHFRLLGSPLFPIGQPIWCTWVTHFV